MKQSEKILSILAIIILSISSFSIGYLTIPQSRNIPFNFKRNIIITNLSVTKTYFVNLTASYCRFTDCIIVGSWLSNCIVKNCEVRLSRIDSCYVQNCTLKQNIVDNSTLVKEKTKP